MGARATKHRFGKNEERFFIYLDSFNYRIELSERELQNQRALFGKDQQVVYVCVCVCVCVCLLSV